MAEAETPLSVIAWDVLGTLHDVLDAPEFRGYGSMAGEVTEDITAQLDDFVDMLEPAHQHALRAERETAEQRRSLWFIVAGTALVAAAAGGLAWYGMTEDIGILQPVVGDGWVGVAATVLVVLFLGGRYGFEASDEHASAKASSRHSRAMYDDLCRTLVEEAARRSINRQLVTAVEVPFVAEAPSLVELDSSRIVPARAVAKVQDFVATHEASAIGVAGPRGIGKSTVLRSLGPDTFDARFSRSLTVQIAAPVAYEPVALPRHIFEEVVLTALGKVDPRRQRWSAANAVARLRFLLGVVLVASGAAIVWWAGRANVDVNALELLGAGVAVAGLAVMFQAYASLWTAWRRTRRSVHWSSKETEDPEAITVLENGLALLRWQSERATTNALTLKVLGGQIESGDSHVETARERDRSRPELVSAFRRMVRDYLQASRRHDQVIVCIDELDKIADPADVVSVINEIKDLMHTRGVHFVVAVSTDAMHSFALRGVPVRDVFDSTFDDIVLVERLSFGESLDVLRARVTGFPTPLSAFCHAWSGGVPRDLIRTARGCREVQRAAGEHVHLRDLAIAVVRADVTAAVAAFLDQNELDGDSEAVLADRLRRGTAPAYREASEAIQRAIDGPAVRAVARHLLFAAEVVEVFGRDMAYGEWVAEESDGSLEAEAERLARRRGRSGRDRLSVPPG